MNWVPFLKKWGCSPLFQPQKKNTWKQHAKATRSSWGYSKSQRLIQPMADIFGTKNMCRSDALGKNNAPKSFFEKSSPGFSRLTFYSWDFWNTYFICYNYLLINGIYSSILIPFTKSHEDMPQLNLHTFVGCQQILPFWCTLRCGTQVMPQQ